MSRTEWEEGTIKIPVQQWVAFRQAVITSHNNEQARRFALAQRAYTLAQLEGKGKRGFDRANWLRNDPRFYEVARFLTRRDNPKVFSPKKQDFKPLPLTRSVVIDRDEAHIRLDNKSRTVQYASGENNHACDNAREDPVVIAMFRALGRIKWVRGSGGEIVGNDEYNQDNRSSFGGGNYVKDQYGPDCLLARKRYSSLAGF